MIQNATVLVIMGSTRAGRVCPLVAQWIARLGLEHTRLRHEIIDLKDWPLPMDDEPTIPAMGRCRYLREKMESMPRNHSDRAKGKMNPLVSKVHGKEKRWSDEFAALRKLCLESGFNEELKWGQACYDLDGGKVVLIHGFKDYCALLFMKGALLKDPQGILIQQTKNVQAARQIRFASLSDINKQKATIKVYLKDAIAVEKSGAKVEMKGVAQFDVPEEFLKRLDDDPQLAEAFHALTPGRQKGYLLHFAGAKQSVTRAARVEKHAPRILKGLGLDD